MWDYRFGSNGYDNITGFQQTSDAGFILGGVGGTGVSGDKTQPSWGLEDFWIVKIDSLGNKQWDKDFGGTGPDKLYCIMQTVDGGFILGGTSSSNVSGDKTQPTYGLWDFWIIKIDSLGNKQWDKDFGGTNGDYLNSIDQTADGGFILGGSSFSGISGNKTEANWDTSGTTADYWIIKTDSLGNKQWDKDFGGSYRDQLYSIQQTSDGGFILGGWSGSGISGSKTQPIWGGYDYWIVKTDSIGNKQWDKDFGGTNYDVLNSIQQTADSGFILGGLSLSGISGDKTQTIWGGYDYWLVKTDFIGNKEWDQDIGGSDNENAFGNLLQMPDGGYLAAGNSSSPLSGNKSENNLGNNQTWVIEIDTLGNLIWDKTLFTDEADVQGLMVRTKDGCYAMANSSAGGIAGYKSQQSWNHSYDYWIIKFCDSTMVNLNDHEHSSSKDLLSVFPNPVTETLTVNSYSLIGTTVAEISTYNVMGEKIYTTVFAGEEINIDCRSFPKGIYFLELASQEKSVRTRFIKQ